MLCVNVSVLSASGKTSSCLWIVLMAHTVSGSITTVCTTWGNLAITYKTCEQSLVREFTFFSVRSEKILKLATNIARQKLVSVGTCFGKFTKTGKFRLHITALDFLAPYAKVFMFFYVLCQSCNDWFRPDDIIFMCLLLIFCTKCLYLKVVLNHCKKRGRKVIMFLFWARSESWHMWIQNFLSSISRFQLN